MTVAIAGYVRACTVLDAHAASPLAPVPDAAPAAVRTDMSKTHVGVPPRYADVTSKGS
ncbi:hypothetical protein [Streptomyces sp. NPDC058092]|uniref:hypothetical protein n=1 Tax=Streptomyces sp. NPDC058092 TaxID=3346336 RepID=UPI0036E85F9E